MGPEFVPRPSSCAGPAVAAHVCPVVWVALPPRRRLRRACVRQSPRKVHELSSDDPGKSPAGEILFRGERIVRAAPELEVFERRRSAERVGVAVVKFESEGLPTSLAPIVLVGASLAIAVKHRAADGCGDVTSA